MARRPARRHAGRRVRARAVRVRGCRQATRMAVLTAGLTRRRSDCATTWAACRGHPAAGQRRPAVPVPARPGVPSLYRDALGLIILVSSLAIAGVLAANARSGGDGVARPLRGSGRDVVLPRPVPARGGVPAAGDQERHRLRAAVRHDVVVNAFVFAGRAGRRARRGRGHPPRPHAAAAGHVRRCCSAAWLLGWLVPSSVAAVAAAVVCARSWPS